MSIGDDQREVVKILVRKGNRLLKRPQRREEFSGIKEADDLINYIDTFPHAFVLACIMDSQVKSERAWVIPYRVSEEIGGFELPRLLGLSLRKVRGIFQSRRLHRFNVRMADSFHAGIQKIHVDYGDWASEIWEGCPASATVVRRFLEFRGVGIKIATMATNILAREFKVPLKDYLCVDVSPDVHVRRVFGRTGLIHKDAKKYEFVYRARELNPNYPGVFDLSAWEIGREWCKRTNPKCEECNLGEYCPKLI